MEDFNFMVIGNHPIEDAFVERGKAYKEVLAFIKEMHQEAINDDQTSISKQNDWVLCQYMLLQRATTEMRMELERLQ